MESMKFGEKINRHRKARGLSQVELAEIVGISAPRFSEWRFRTSEDVEISLAKFRRLAMAIGVTLDYLADDSQDDPPPGLSESEARVVALMRALNLPESMALARLAGPQVGTPLVGITELDIRQTRGEPPRMAPRRSPATPAGSPPEIAPSDAESTTPGPPPPRRKR